MKNWKENLLILLFVVICGIFIWLSYERLMRCMEVFDLLMCAG